MSLVLVAVLLLLLFAPQLLTQHLLKKYSHQRNDLPGTGGELADHLIQRFSLKGVTTEISSQGDHYDPVQRKVRLSQSNYQGKSLTAVAVAAHEVGHAIQHQQGSGGIKLRTKLAVIALFASRGAQFAAMALPLLIGLSPGLGRLALMVIILGILTATLLHLVTLPVEWDASFNKALPVLAAGQYLTGEDLNIARKLLTACAFTYVSGALASLLGLARWLRYRIS